MFDSIVLRSDEAGNPVTLGQIADAMLFYGHVHLVIQQSTLYGLIRKLGGDGTIRLLSRPEVSATYCEDILATQTETIGFGLRAHRFVAVTFGGHQDDERMPKNASERIEFSLVRSLGLDRKVARKFTVRFREKVKVKRLDGDYFLPGGIVSAAVKDAFDTEFLHKATQSALLNLAPPFDPGRFRFEIHGIPERFMLETDLPLSEIEKLHPSVTEAGLIGEILTAAGDLAISAHYGGDFQTKSSTSAIIQVRHREMLRRSGLNAAQLKSFSEISLPDGRSVRDAIDSNLRSFEEFERLLKSSERFKKWVKGVSPDEALARAYLVESTAQGPLESLPVKTLRYVLGLAIDAATPLIGPAYSILDGFLLDKFAGGWRPSHFVEKTLKPFVAEP